MSEGFTCDICQAWCGEIKEIQKHRTETGHPFVLRMSNGTTVTLRAGIWIPCTDRGVPVRVRR